jgi:hypothetical protein
MILKASGGETASHHGVFPLEITDRLTFLAAPHQSPALTFNSQGEVIISIEQDGEIKWRGREIETDDDFKAAMMDLRAVFMPRIWS